MADIILHQFDASPFAEKLRLALGLKGLAWRAVDAELILPKPKLTALTGGYRKTPVMQIGADIYCDSRLIAVELEARHPTPTLFPGGNRGLSLALAAWSDRDFHVASSGSAIGANKHVFPAELMRDRKAYFEDFLDVEKLDADLPHLTTQLRAHADLIEQQLSDGRLFWLGDEPGLADFHAYVEVWTARAQLSYAAALFAPFTHMCRWEERVRAIGHGKQSTLDAEGAHAVARDSTPLTGKGVDAADALKLAVGDLVEVTPDDYGRVPVRGRLVTLTTHEVAVERDDPIVGTVVVHFPRIGYRITAATQ
ncbi:Thioredoxin-like fold protein [Niveomyces insectorum RCEF 264]|uniref:Thioredoxin-like fold protein n=1 Tax=Niveomyces insectorum RCEF 264 TaxID=1081102 RepID=A0A167T8U3_9HYPO|nr:Thioredoxin-like fold protein [Niveomyces insectorum RCEF 264]